MKKLWSITTTLRNPERLKDFLLALQPLEGSVWDKESQEKYQKLLIKNRLYGYGNTQFYNGLTSEIIQCINDRDCEISDAMIDEIVKLKKYVDFDMRGRQSLNPLTKLGFVVIEEKIVKTTSLGKALLEREKDSGDLFLISLIKWQLPNKASSDYPDTGDYDIVPFVATLKLIAEVNKLEIGQGNKAVGLSKREFSLFVPTLIHFKKIENQAIKIIEFRAIQKGKSKEKRKEIRDAYRQEFAKNFLQSDDKAAIKKMLKNLKDYGDNSVRYFRLTKFIRIRGNGFYIDLEPSRATEIESLFEREFYKSKIFDSKKEYLAYMSNSDQPVLPWQTKEKLIKIAEELLIEIKDLQKTLDLEAIRDIDVSVMNENELSSYIVDLRGLRKSLQEKDNHFKSQPISSVQEYIEKLENIFSYENRPILLEYLTTLGLHALNDAKEIRPNYPVGDDNEPTSTAPGGMADIECFYNNFNMICEVTMLKGRDQWFNEGQPVMRHLREFEKKHNNAIAYCIFIAPVIHTDTSETFFIANSIGYKGDRQKIVPLTIKQFVYLLKTLVKMRENNMFFSHTRLQDLLEKIVKESFNIKSSDLWIIKIQNIIEVWAHLDLPFT